MVKTISKVMHMLWVMLSLFGLTGFSSPKPTLADSKPLLVHITQIDTMQFPKVTVYVSVSDSEGNPVEVSPSQLVLTENGQEMRLEAVKGIGDREEPLITLLVLDVSGSMNAAGKLEAAKKAARAYVNQTRPNDLTGLLTFNTRVVYEQPITQDRDKLIEAINNLKAKDDTALYDALLEAIKILEGLPGRKAVIALTDGMDNRSKSTPKQVIDQINTQSLSISTIGLGDANYNRGNLAGLDEAMLIYLAEHAGGVYGYANDATSLTKLYERYGRALQSEYALTYTSPSVLRDGVNRAIRVSLKASATSSATETHYNPGGLIPEVPKPASWWVFGGLVAALIVLLVLPLVLKNVPNLPKQTGRVKLSGESKTPSPKVKLK